MRPRQEGSVPDPSLRPLRGDPMDLPDTANALRVLFESTDPKVGRVLAQCGVERAGPGGPSRRQLHAYFLVVISRWTLAQAADVMGISHQSVRALVVRARRNMVKESS